MALHRNVTLDEIDVVAHIQDFTTGSPAAFAASPIKGEVIELRCTQHASSAGTASVITAAINGTNITGGTISVAAGAAGITNTTLITNPGITARVNENDTIGFTSNGASNDATVPATLVAVIRNRRK